MRSTDLEGGLPTLTLRTRISHRIILRIMGVFMILFAAVVAYAPPSFWTLLVFAGAAWSAFFLFDHASRVVLFFEDQIEVRGLLRSKTLDSPSSLTMRPYYQQWHIYRPGLRKWWTRHVLTIYPEFFPGPEAIEELKKLVAIEEDVQA